MTRRFAMSALIILVGLLAAGTGLRAGEARPFLTELHYTADLVDPTWADTCTAQNYDGAFSVTRTGQATHLGRVTEEERGCTAFGDYPVVHSVGWLKVTAANGDVLNLTVRADFDFAQEKPVATGTFTIVGGTGRFANAVGSGAVSNVPTVEPGNIMILDGAIVYAASDRAKK
jgi:hypothetical protein